MNDEKDAGGLSALTDVLDMDAKVINRLESIAADYGLLPCPFCGAGNFDIGMNGRIWTGTKFSDPASVSIRHWCPSEGRPGRMIERVGRDLADAVAAWNMRSNAAISPPRETG